MSKAFFTTDHTGKMVDGIWEWIDEDIGIAQIQNGLWDGEFKDGALVTIFGAPGSGPEGESIKNGSRIVNDARLDGVYRGADYNRAIHEAEVALGLREA